MYLVYTASTDGDNVKEGRYVELAVDFETARQIAERNASMCDGVLYDCFMVKDNSLYWLLKRNNGGWDFFYDTGTPLIVNTMGLNQSWYDFELDADEEKLEKAKKEARDGSYQAIYDAYQSLDLPHSGYGYEFSSYGTGLAGLGYDLSDFGSSSYDTGLDSFDFGSSYSDFQGP